MYLTVILFDFMHFTFMDHISNISNYTRKGTMHIKTLNAYFKQRKITIKNNSTLISHSSIILLD